MYSWQEGVNCLMSRSATMAFAQEIDDQANDIDQVFVRVYDITKS